MNGLFTSLLVFFEKKNGLIMVMSIYQFAFVVVGA